MKILHIVSSYWPAFKMGGPIYSVHLLNKSLVQKGADVSVFTTNAGLENEKNRKLGVHEIIDGVNVFRFPYYGYINYSFSPALFWKLKREIKNFDVIHIAEIWNFPVFATVFWARFYKKPYIVSPRGSLMVEPLRMKSPLKKKMFLFLAVKRFLKNAVAVHFTAEVEKEEYLKAGLYLKNSIIIPNGIDINGLDKNGEEAESINFKKDIGVAPNKKIVLFLSRIDWKKGLDTLIPAFAGVVKKMPDSVLVLAGADSDYKKTVENFINASGAGDKIIFAGLLDGAQRAAAFKSADVFVLPSYAENFGMAVAEAMCFGLPVIITKYIGIAPEIKKNNAGVIIEKDEKELTGSILDILKNPSVAKKMGENGRKLAEKEFSVLAIADKFFKLYNDINEGRIL